MFSFFPSKSGMRTSNVVSGLTFLIVLMVFAQNEAPPSDKSSLSTEVITQCFSFINLIDSARRLGSFWSTGPGFPVFTPQNLHERVQISPKIINVAVPLFQHSPMFGHVPLVQMVCNLYFSTIFLTLE